VYAAHIAAECTPMTARVCRVVGVAVFLLSACESEQQQTRPTEPVPLPYTPAIPTQSMAPVISQIGEAAAGRSARFDFNVEHGRLKLAIRGETATPPSNRTSASADPEMMQPIVSGELGNSDSMEAEIETIAIRRGSWTSSPPSETRASDRAITMAREGHRAPGRP
jgi:hypothetical protein